MMPPKGRTGAELWAEITQCPREHRLVPFPRMVGGEQVEVAMIVLTQEESMLANLNTEKHVRKMMKDDLPKNGEVSEGYTRLYELCASLEILQRAVRCHDDVTKPFFKSREDIGKVLTTDEIGILIREYNAVRSDLGPVITQMTQDEVDAWIEKLAEAIDVFPLVFLDSALQSRLILTMASRLHKLQTAKTSATEQLDGITYDA